jgi:ribosomal protein L24E
MYGQFFLAASVLLFAATKAEKAFGFRVNQVYLRWACARKQGHHPAHR